MVYDAASRLVTSVSGTTTTTYTYDVNGNMTGVNAGGSLSTLTWDKENRLTRNQRTASSLDETHVYNAFNHKMSRSSGGKSDYYIYDGDQYVAYAIDGGPIDASFEIVDGRPDINECCAYRGQMEFLLWIYTNNCAKDDVLSKKPIVSCVENSRKYKCKERYSKKSLF